MSPSHLDKPAAHSTHPTKRDDVSTASCNSLRLRGIHLPSSMALQLAQTLSLCPFSDIPQIALPAPACLTFASLLRAKSVAPFSAPADAALRLLPRRSSGISHA